MTDEDFSLENLKKVFSLSFTLSSLFLFAMTFLKIVGKVTFLHETYDLGRLQH